MTITICDDCKKKTIAATADLGGKFNCMICNELQTGVSSIGHGKVCFECERKGYCKWCGRVVEFNLSKRKIKNVCPEYLEEDVKEFIRLLKKDLEINLVQVPHILGLELRYIDKLAGDKLI